MKKKVAIFGVKYFPSKGGTSRVVETLLEEMKEEFDFTIYCYKNPLADNHMNGVNTIQFKEIPIKGIGVFLFFLRCFLHLYRKGNFDLVHIHKTDAAFFIPFLEKKFNIITTSHALPYLNDKWSGLGKAYFKRVEKIFMNSKSQRTTISKTQAEYYESTYKNPIQYIPNGIHEPNSPDPKLAFDILKKHDVTEPYLFFAARRLIPLKGCHTLITALQKMNFEGTLVIAADIEQLPSYTKKIKDLVKGIDVKFLGYVADRDTLNALIQQAELFIFPSEIEGMSMMLLEVGCMGTPMICSDIPQNKAVLTDAEVLFFKSKDAEDLVEKLQWAKRFSKKMKTLGEQCQAKILSEYLMENISQQYKDLYRATMSTTKKEAANV